ncbi:MAG: hypothetical protein ABI467_15485 [Kofleriaceae bacterium]
MRALLIFLAGCGFAPHAGTPSTGDGGGGDGGDAGGDIDAALPTDAVLGDAPPACTMWHPQHFQPCTLGSPLPMMVLGPASSPYTYDTTTDGGDLTDKNGTLLAHSPITIMQPDATVVAIYSVAKFAVMSGAVLNVVGPKPLIIASWDKLDVMGDLDAGSHTTETDATAHIQQTTQPGAGNASCGPVAATSTASAASAGQDAVLSGGSGGGGGGAFHGSGGNGATGDQACTPPATCPRLGGIGGTGAPGMPITIRGGCGGAASGQAGPGAQSPATATTIARGGLGGGAIELAAKGDIHISGTVRAGGAAGAGAPQGSAVGGGGGGAGGYIGFDGHMVALMGTIAANGGGGGGSAPFASFGNGGQDGQPSQTAANGGAAYSGGGCGLAGAKGSSTTIDGVAATGSDTCGGGGGGGGGGWVIAWAMTVTGAGVVSPQLTTITVP